MMRPPTTNHTNAPDIAAPDINPSSLDMGWRYWKSGDLERAAALCRDLLRSCPDAPDVLHLAGMVLWKRGMRGEAQAMFERAVAVDPHQPRHYNNLGAVLNETGQYQLAMRCLERAIQLKPHYSDAYCNLGLSLFRMNALSHASACLDRAVALDPEHACSHANLGMVRLAQGAMHQAIQAYSRAVSIDAGQARWWANLSAAHMAAGNFTESARCMQRALRLCPQDLSYCNGLAVALRASGDLAGSLRILYRAHTLNSQHGETLSNLGIVLQETCRWDAMADCFKRLDRATLKALSSVRLPDEQPMFTIRRNADRELNLAVARAWSQAARRRALRTAEPFDGHDRQPGPHRITLGYVSYDFRDHPVTHQLLPLFSLHDRNRFRVLAFSMGPDDAGAYRTLIRKSSDGFIDIAKMNFQQSAAQIHHHRVDILIDLMGHSHHNRLEILALRPAPVQISYLGFLSTTGSDFVDYIIADPIVVPNAHAAQYTESLIYLPHCYQMNHDTFHQGGTSSQRRDWGLPEEAFVFCSFNRAYKIDRNLFECWMSILHRVPHAVLWLYDDNPMARQALLDKARSCGIDPQRLIFSPKTSLPDHLHRLELADLALDTVTYNGGATTSNALWAGLPVLTVLGDDWTSRMTASHLNAAGISELIQHDLDAYEQTAVTLAHSPELVKALRCRLIANRATHPLFKPLTFVRHLEKGYEAVWQRHCSGQTPAHLMVPPGEPSERPRP